MNLIARPTGLGVIEFLIELLENKKEVQKVIDEIDAARIKANERIAIVGKAQDVDRLHGKADAALRDANRALEEAKFEAEKVKKKAGLSAVAKQRKAQEVLQAAVDREAEVSARERTVTAREKELQKHMDATAKLNKEAAELKISADALMVKANEQLALFRGVASQIN